MKLQPVLVTFVLLIGWCYPCTASDEHPDVGHDEDVHPNTLTETNGDVLDIDMQTIRDVPDTSTETNWDDNNKDNYEDADWHPPSSLLETDHDLHPDFPPVIRSGNTGVTNSANQTFNRTIGSSSAQCGEYSSQLMSNGQCRLMATLPPVPVGTSQKRCPDMFRCTDDVSNWLHENQNRKEQLEELRETMSELQEELRNHRHRVKALEMQDGESVGLNSTFDQRLHSLELRYTEANTLLHVHAALLYELQEQLHNLSATVERMSRNTGCTINVIRTTPLLGMRDTLPPDGQHLSFCPSDCASLYLNGVRRSGVYNIVLSPGATLPVYCDMETEGGGWTVFQRRHDGSVSFNRGWSEYRSGFGEPRGEHWLGNQQLHLLSNHGHYSLRIDLQDWSHAHRYALYHTFRGQLNGLQKRSQIGGRYSLKAQNLLGPDGIVWFSWKESDFYSLKAVTMMIRPRHFRPRLSP
ncbi:angiopoietin-2-like [Morone saxatilis]|uniref:angiopoietin-2-like n=1 Tax=Morone saxatilis TaxID=34816 RepID=UPI0015E24D72|nr:angiopoietin-2-like [Morone saxatilis]